MTKDNKAGKFAVGAAVAAIAGYITGILTAPKSGKETRKDIHDATIKARREAEKKLKEAHSELNRLIELGQKKLASATDKTRQGVHEAVEQAKATKDKVKTALSAIHEGDSEDKDLALAIKEADKAIAHLKKYLSSDEKTQKQRTKK